MPTFDVPPSPSPFTDACRRLLSEIVVPPSVNGIPVRVDPSAREAEFRTPGQAAVPLKFVSSLVVLVALLAAPLEAAPPKWLVNLSCGGAVTAGFSEIVLTEACVQRGTCRETNPLLPHGTTKGESLGRAIIKGTGTAVVVRLAYVPKNPWARFGVCSGTAAFNAYLASRAWRRLP